MDNPWTDALSKAQADHAVKLFQQIKKILHGHDAATQKAAVFLVASNLEVTQNEQQAPAGAIPIQPSAEGPEGSPNDPKGN